MESAELEQWRTARNAVRHLHASNATYSASLAAMVEFVPKVFHRQHEMKKTDTRHMRAVLDYIIYLQDPADKVGAIQRRQCKEPYYRNDVIGALRDAIPARIFLQPEIDWLKDDLQDNDVGPVLLAARSFILELTEGQPGQSLTGAETFADTTLVNIEVSRSRDGSSSNEDFPFAKSTLTQDTTLGPDPIALSQPMSASSTDTSATQMLYSYTKPVDQIISPSRRMSLPDRGLRSHRNSLGNKRAASENRGRAFKRTRVKEIVEEADVTQTNIWDDEQNRYPSTPTAEMSYEMVKVSTSIAGPLQKVQEAVLNLEDEMGALKITLRTRDQEAAKLTATINKLEEDAAQQSQNSVDVACLREVLKASIEKASHLEKEVAVLRVLAKRNGVLDEEVDAQLAKITAA